MKNMVSIQTMKTLMNRLLSKDLRIHIYVTIGFVIISLLFYHPLLQGKKLFQSDISQYEGMSREIKENRNIEIKRNKK